MVIRGVSFPRPSPDHIIDGLLTFARSGGEPEQGASSVVSELLVDVASDFATEAEAARVELVIEPAPAISVACSAGPLASILGNLIRNALKFVADGTNGHRRVVVRAATTKARVDAVIIEGEDTGPGIPARMEQSIFDPFVRARTSAGKPFAPVVAPRAARNEAERLGPRIVRCSRTSVRQGLLHELA